MSLESKSVKNRYIVLQRGSKHKGTFSARLARLFKLICPIAGRDEMAEQATATAPAESAADESDFSTSSVDQFLRDHGFDIADHAGLELSSLSDDDINDDNESDLSEQLQQQHQPQQAHAGDDDRTGGGTTRTPSRLHVVPNVSPDIEEKEGVEDAPPRLSERRRRRSLFDAQSASEEEEPMTPRFTLLNDKDLVFMQGEQTASASTVTPIAEVQDDDSHLAHEVREHGDEDHGGHESDGRDSLDRSMVLGVGSGFSGFSSSGVDERSRIAQILHEKGASPVVSIQRSRDLQQQRSNSLSSSPSIVPGSSVDSLASGSRRVQDDELSDALGVTSSTPEQDSSIFTRVAVSSRLSRASVHQRRVTIPINRPSGIHSSQRALFAVDDEERKESEGVGTRESFQANQQQQQRPSITRSEPYVQRSSIPSRADESRVRASSVPSADDGGWGDLNDKLRKHGLQVITFERIHAAGGIAMTVPNRASVFDCVQDVVLQLERKDQVRCRGLFHKLRVEV